jgi:hypothetical protein
MEEEGKWEEDHGGEEKGKQAVGDGVRIGGERVTTFLDYSSEKVC